MGGTEQLRWLTPRPGAAVAPGGWTCAPQSVPPSGHLHGCARVPGRLPWLTAGLRGRRVDIRAHVPNLLECGFLLLPSGAQDQEAGLSEGLWRCSRCPRFLEDSNGIVHSRCRPFLLVASPGHVSRRLSFSVLETRARKSQNEGWLEGWRVHSLSSYPPSTCYGLTLESSILQERLGASA